MTVVEKVQKILREEADVAIVLGEILSPPPSISTIPRPWES